MKKHFKSHDARCTYYSQVVSECERTEDKYGFSPGSLNYVAFCLDASITDIPAQNILNLQQLGQQNIFDLVVELYHKCSSPPDRNEWLKKYGELVQQDKLKADIAWEKGYRKFLLQSLTSKDATP